MKLNTTKAIDVASYNAKEGELLKLEFSNIVLTKNTAQKSFNLAFVESAIVSEGYYRGALTLNGFE